jgi:hypothetical protein
MHINIFVSYSFEELRMTGYSDIQTDKFVIWFLEIIFNGQVFVSQLYLL